MYYEFWQSPLGPLTLVSDGISLTELHIEGDTYFSTVAKDWKHNQSLPIFTRTKIQLQEYFDKKRQVFDLPLAPVGTTCHPYWSAHSQ
jgi:methylated-DNA-[protein]-cysteine S-methyltransferase